MSYDLGKVMRYGRKIGAEYALIINGELSRYYKKGDKASKYCPYFYANFQYDVPLGWRNSYNPSIHGVAEFYTNLGNQVELLEITKAVSEGVKNEEI